MTSSNDALADEIAIERLIYHYNSVLDATDYTGWSKTFTEDGIFRGAHADWVPQRDLEPFAAAAINRRQTGAPASRHYVTNVEVHLDSDGNTAKADCYVMVTAAADGGKPTVNITGRYEDFVVKTPEGWRFRERRVHVDGLTRPWPAPGEHVLPEPGERPYDAARAGSGH